VKYGCILADPPWAFRTYSAKGEGKSASRHYSVMTLGALKALPVASLAAPDCALLVWATFPLLPEALEVISAWGFTFKGNGFLWAKQSTTGRTWHFGCGYGTRKNTEPCLLATRGSPRRLPTGASVRELVVAPRREHSRKPDEVRDQIRLLFPGPYLELFARERADGWHAWGNEVSPAPCLLSGEFILPCPNADSSPEANEFGAAA
jgi:N6-adenosine-specific RNA methylase IME4